MSNIQRHRIFTRRRRSRAWSWLTVLAVVALVAAGVFFSTGPKEQALSGGGPSHPGVPNMQSR